MIKFENTVLPSGEQWRAIITGMRNPLNSWHLSDSAMDYPDCNTCPYNDTDNCPKMDCFVVGEKDLDLMRRLRTSGTDHRKYLRMIAVYVDITAPLYWWKECDTYKIGTVANSCSTMHKIAAKEFKWEDFSNEHLAHLDIFNMEDDKDAMNALQVVINALNYNREKYLETKDKKYWWQMIQLLPNSYNQKRTVMLNYEVLNNMYKSRKNHKLDEWSTGFVNWVKTLPYAKELITGGE